MEEGAKLLSKREIVESMLKPGGNLLDEQVGKDAAIRDITKQEGGKIIKQLMQLGAKEVSIQPSSYIGKGIPTEEEYLLTLEFIEYLMDKYKDKLEYSFGPGDVITDKTPQEFIIWLRKKWYAGKYEEIDYGVWFDLKE